MKKNIINYYSLRYIWDLIVILTLKEIKVKYKRNLLGFFWSILNPLLLTLVFIIAFKGVLKIHINNYLLFLITGLFPWQWVTNVILSAPNILLSNASIIKKIKFPYEILPLALTLSEGIHFLLSLLVLIIIGLFYNLKPSINWLWGIPLLLLAQGILIYGLALIISSINLFFRDLERIVQVFMTMLFYLTPILYDIKHIPQKYIIFFALNPFFGIIYEWRTLLLKGYLDIKIYILYLLYSLLIFIVGLKIFRKLSKKFAEAL